MSVMPATPAARIPAARASRRAARPAGAPRPGRRSRAARCRHARRWRRWPRSARSSAGTAVERDSSGKSRAATASCTSSPAASMLANGPIAAQRAPSPATTARSTSDDVAHARLHERIRLAQQRVLEPVRDEAGHVAPHADRLLADRPREREQALEDVRRRLRRGHDLDERDELGRVEPVPAGEALGTGERLAERGEGERRRVRGDDAVVGDEPLGSGEHAALGLQVLGDRLDREPEGRVQVVLRSVDPHRGGRRAESLEAAADVRLRRSDDLATPHEQHGVDAGRRQARGDPPRHDAASDDERAGRGHPQKRCESRYASRIRPAPAT